MRIVITGADGCIGRHLYMRLRELGHDDVMGMTRASTDADLRTALRSADFVYHLALASDEDTSIVCSALVAAERCIPLAYVSSDAASDADRIATPILARYGIDTASPVFVLRLATVFGKWSRPTEERVVTTLCQELVQGNAIVVDDPSSPLSLLYVDDAIGAMIRLLGEPARSREVDVGPVYLTTMGEVATILQSFADSRRTSSVPRVGAGLTRALYATYLSHLPPAAFQYGLTPHSDPRGTFVEVLKTSDCGQFAYFTAGPGVTRGGHYHHTKSEKFLVVRGKARFRFRDLLTNETYEILVDDMVPQVVETVPGWAHDITNIGSEEMIVMLWANEVFDPNRPDTIAATVSL
jgi:UDP-2-acetamido-2,6-beta-L-arabino-hexul-4-ose reductase